MCHFAAAGDLLETVPMPVSLTYQYIRNPRHASQNLGVARAMVQERPTREELADTESLSSNTGARRDPTTETVMPAKADIQGLNIIPAQRGFHSQPIVFSTDPRSSAAPRSLAPPRGSARCHPGAPGTRPSPSPSRHRRRPGRPGRSGRHRPCSRCARRSGAPA